VQAAGRAPLIRPANSRRWTTGLLAGLALTTLAADQGTKLWAQHSSLAQGRVVPLIPGVIELKLIGNGGAAFSFGSSATWVFTVLSALVVIGIAWYARRVRSRLWAAALGLVAGGALGNVVDRLTQPPGFGRGHVVDFIAYGDWFIGNVADIAICVAAGLLIIAALRGTRPAGSGGHEPERA
jgi:signal peptidase II